jgi:HAD superfamily phosphatase (TIGR01668 family)
MLTLLTPDLQLDSILELGVTQLRALGIKGLLLDVDCTLKDYKASTFPANVVAWVAQVQEAGVRLCLLSNGKPHRIEPLAKSLGVDYVAHALKPFPFGCRAGLRKLSLPPEQTAVVGDQIFADILAGRLAGMRTILVRPTTNVEPWFTRLKRPLERRVLRWINGRKRKSVLP